MSYTVRPYLVDLARLHAAAGSRDAALLADLQKKYADRLRPKDRAAGTAPGPPPSPAADALRRIIEGGIGDDPREAPRYAAALELLCDHFGDRLDNELFQDTRAEYLEEVGAIEDLLKAGPPLPIPRTDDFPLVGHCSPHAAGEALARLEGLPPHPASVVNQGREQLGDWLHAAVREARGVVVFYG